MNEQDKRWTSYKETNKELPWRINRSLYTTLVSEIMLQQTTVGTVKNHFPLFIEKYSALEMLASIDEQQMLKEWKGLGYYRRARNLLNAVKSISKNYNGIIPLDYNKLVEIDGIGPYTANAILAIGADKHVLALDANLERVLARFYGVKSEKGLKLQKELYSLFEEGRIATEIKSIGGRDFNEGVMDIGRNICMVKKAYCELCPLRKDCYALKNSVVADLPYQKEKKNDTKNLELHIVRFIVRKNNQVLAYRKSSSEWLSNQYEVPSFTLYCEESSFKQYPAITGDYFYYLQSFKSSITCYKIKNYVIEMSEQEFKSLGRNEQQFEYHEILNGNLSTASSKAINLLYP